MFNVGGMELVVVGVLALVVLGPDRLPGALRQAGTLLGKLRQISQGFHTDLTSAIAAAETDAQSASAPSAPAEPGTPDTEPANHGRPTCEAPTPARQARTSDP